jgi:APA family basic amino acid/polyamine antiporter
MVDLTNIGTLFAFVLVCVGITILRYKDPDRHRPFRVPLGAWFLPILGALSCLFLMYYLPPTSWWRFVAWLMIGLSVYLSYSYSRSQIGRALGRPEKTPGWLMLLGLGSLLIAVGILIVPHEASLNELLRKFSAGFAEDKRTFIALNSIALGLALSVLAVFIGFVKRRQETQ